MKHICRERSNGLMRNASRRARPYLPIRAMRRRSSLRQLDPRIAAERRLDMFFYGVGVSDGMELKTQWELLMRLRDWGFKTNPHSRRCMSIDEAAEECALWEERRCELAYDIDGLVLKLDSMDGQEADLVTTAKRIRGGRLHISFRRKERLPYWRILLFKSDEPECLHRLRY